ncbi:hypothetical protein CC79DRAFT_1395478 [Sarocladium strictum]
MAQLCIKQSSRGALLLYNKEKAPIPDPDASSPQDSLTIHESTPTVPSSITNLPDELLQQCFQIAIRAAIDHAEAQRWSDSRCAACNRYQTARRLIRVCSRFAAIARPVLYANIDLSTQASVDCVRYRKRHLQHAELFLHTVSQHSHVLRWIRRLSVDVDFFARLRQPGPETVSCLSLTLNDLTLGDWSAARMQEQWDSFAGALDSLAGLTALTLNRLEEGTIPRPIHAPTSQLKELHLIDCSLMSPVTLQNLMCWTRSLESFTLGCMGIGGYDLETLISMELLTYAWTWRDLHIALEPQHNSLRYLNIGQIATQTGLDSFSLHEFTALHTFQTYMPFGGTASGEALAALWLTPSLAVLVLDCAWDDSQCGKVYMFGGMECGWLTAFAAGVAQRRSSASNGGPAVGLQRIELLFELEGTPWASHESEQASIAWMAEAWQRGVSYGVQIVLPDFPGRHGEARVQDLLTEL